MKKLTKFLCASGMIGLAAKKIQALNNKQSLRSLLVQDALNFVDILPVPESNAEYQRAYEKSLEEYQLPKSVQFLYNFKQFHSFKDTYELIPTNSWQKKVIFYIHGGAYWIQPTVFHFNTVNDLATKLNARIILPIYPKAPAYSAKDVHAMVLERYLYLINEEKIPSNDIIVMGDSAGGGCSLALLEMLREQGYPQPSRAILLSPWLDVSNSNPEMIDIQPHDHMLNIENLRYQGRIFAGDLPMDNPLVSPLHADLENLAPITIFSGTYDILHADSVKLYTKALENNWDVTLYNYQKMSHVFSILPTAEGKESIEKIVGIIGNEWEFAINKYLE